VRIHEYLEILDDPEEGRLIRCVRCGHRFCRADENYKEHALYIERKLDTLPLRQVLSGEDSFVVYQEFLCPGCGTLLEVDAYCPQLEEGNDPIIWDIQIR